MPARAAGEPSSTACTSSPSRSGRPTDRRRRRATWGGATAIPRRGRRGTSPRPSAVEPVAQRVVGGQREVEAVTHPVGVDPHQPAVRRRPPVRPTTPGREGRCARWRPSTRRPPGPRNGTSRAETKPTLDPHTPAARIGQGHDGLAPAGGRVARARDGASAGVHRHHRQIPVDVDAGGPARGPAAVVEGDHDLVAPDVVGVGHHQPGPDHDPAASGPHAHHRRRHAGSTTSATDFDSCSITDAMTRPPVDVRRDLRRYIKTCNLQVTIEGWTGTPADGPGMPGWTA